MKLMQMDVNQIMRDVAPRACAGRGLKHHIADRKDALHGRPARVRGARIETVKYRGQKMWTKRSPRARARGAD